MTLYNPNWPQIFARSHGRVEVSTTRSFGVIILSTYWRRHQISQTTPQNGKKQKKIAWSRMCAQHQLLGVPLVGQLLMCQKNKIKIKQKTKKKTTILTWFPIKGFLIPLRYKINLRAHLTSNQPQIFIGCHRRMKVFSMDSVGAIAIRMTSSNTSKNTAKHQK